MARGDFTVFEEFVLALGSKEHNIGATDVLKLGIVTNVVTPTAADATPTWADYSANDVSAAGGYVADGLTLTFTGVTRWEEAAGTATLDADDISLSQNGSGFTDAYWGILYNSSSTGNQAIGFLDLGGPVSEQAGPVNINWNASGILTIAVSVT